MNSFKLSNSSEPKVSGETKKCPECLADIPKEAKKCSHCGTKQKATTSKGKFIFLLIVLGISMSTLISVGDSLSEPSTTIAPAVSDTQVNIMAENYVETILKSPSTAKFPNLQFTHYDLGNNKHQIVSYVDSQNSYGATVRSDWSATLTYKGGDWSNQNNWTLNELVLDGEKVYGE